MGHGRATARKLAGFGCRLLVSDPHAVSTTGIEAVDLEALMTQAHVVIVHAPLKPGTHHLIDGARLARMKPGGLLVNASRGAVVDTQAVIDALHSGQLSGAALDVLESEPQVPQALRTHPGAMLTPHIAFSSDASLAELRRRAAEEVVRVLRGEKPQQPCNQPVGAVDPALAHSNRSG